MSLSTLQSLVASIRQPCVGLLVSIDESGVPFAAFADNPAELPVACRVAIPLGRDALGRSVLLLPDPRDGIPIIVGVVRDHVAPPSTDADAPGGQCLTQPHRQLSIDDEEVSLVATKRISLRCGKASITLDAEGNVEIRGQYVLSRAARQNKIKGASVSLN